MTKKLIICVWALSVVIFGSGKSFATVCQDPIAGMTVEPGTYDPVLNCYYICIEKDEPFATITFDSFEESEDPDCPCCTECGITDVLNGIKEFKWDFGLGDTSTENMWSQDDGNFDGVTTHDFDPGHYSMVRLTVTDEGDCCCNGCDDASEDECVHIFVFQTGLEAVSAGNTPDLEPGRVCNNAQACYKKAKWKAIVKPSGITAAVTSTGDIEVNFTGIDGSDPSALEDGDEFWAEIDASETEIGTYKIKIQCLDVPYIPFSCYSEATGDVFKFEFDLARKTDNDSSGTTGGAGTATANETTGKVEAPAIESATPGITEGAYVKQGYEMKVITNPSGMYTGDVKAKASVTLKTDGEMILSNGARPAFAEHGALSISFPPVGVSIPSGGWWADYGSSVAGADCSIKIATETEVELGDAKKDYTDVGFPILFPRKSETWEIDLTQVQNDITRIYTIGQLIELWIKVGVASSISDLVWDLYLLSPVVEKNEQTIDSVEVKEHDDEFEIE